MTAGPFIGHARSRGGAGRQLASPCNEGWSPAEGTSAGRVGETFARVWFQGLRRVSSHAHPLPLRGRLIHRYHAQSRRVAVRRVPGQRARAGPILRLHRWRCSCSTVAAPGSRAGRSSEKRSSTGSMRGSRPAPRRGRSSSPARRCSPRPRPRSTGLARRRRRLSVGPQAQNHLDERSRQISRPSSPVRFRDPAQIRRPRRKKTRPLD